ncbi:ammonium transporter [Oleiagrimonas sp. C23AA]|uniref:ammonium transporter n=1 Tax=Oleiagrimonas sp. C23AA TaxID=2719047 RepID=UPI00142109F7|nr:ammonium transporter [Oleiagrimonas sp. C23AA]NII10047.1 ammonium transporter [Oleiagrimonas sp. C23AA]
MTFRHLFRTGTAMGLALAALPACAAPATLDSGDTAWMLTSCALVLMMTIPGLALFYGGMVRAKNLLSVLMQCFAITALVSVLWVIYGYSLAFNTTGMQAGVVNWHSIVGGLGQAMLAGMTPSTLSGTVPESVFVMFQMTFAIITPALIVGAFAERMKFTALLWFTGLWFTFVYAPMAHMVWGGAGSLLGGWGVLDFAGGTVVHINAGIAGLIACLVIGKRKGYPNASMAPHNLGYTLVGASMLWLGWFGFNAGSAVAANGSAGMAMLVTQIATAAAALGWMVIEWIRHGRPSVLGIASGAVAGLVAVTPAAGTAGPGGALVLGLLAGVICFFCATTLKHKLGYDDSLDVFGVHAMAGIVGALLTGPLASATLGGFGDVTSLFGQLWIQTKGVAFTVVYSGVLTYVILKVLGWTVGLRVDEEQEAQGLDLALHDERAYNL